MKKTISLFAGSPRKNGNTEFIMQRIFDQLIKNTNAEVKYFSLIDYDINRCIGCRSCMQLKHCIIQDDDFEDIFKAVKDSDVTIWGAPVYWMAPPGIMKDFIDRTHGYYACEPMLTGQEAYIINIATESGFRNHEAVMRSWLEWYGAEIKATVDIYAREKDDIRNNPEKIKQVDEFIENVLLS